MSETYKKIKSEIVIAMKAKDSERLLTVRSLDSAIKNISINSGHREGPTEEDVVVGLNQAVKRGLDSAEQFKAAGRTELADAEIYQVHIAREFLPAQLSSEDLKKLVLDVVDLHESECGLVQKDFGSIMKKCVAKANGAADNKSISEAIKSLFKERGL